MLPEARVRPSFWLEKSKLKKCDAVWIAAVLDCEGTLTVHTPYNLARKSRNIQVFARVQMTNPAIPLQLKSLCGGTYRGFKPAPSDRPNTSPPCFWNLSSNGLRWLLPQILPYFLIKRRHAKILLEILAKNKRGVRGEMSGREIFGLISELRAMNHRGVKQDLSKILDTKGNSVLCMARPTRAEARG